jgi:hypothetical protein
MPVLPLFPSSFCSILEITLQLALLAPELQDKLLGRIKANLFERKNFNIVFIINQHSEN